MSRRRLSLPEQGSAEWRKLAKSAIHDIEYFNHSAAGKLSGISVAVSRFYFYREDKNVTATVTVVDEDGKRQYHGCDYPVDVLEKQMLDSIQCRAHRRPVKPVGTSERER